MAPRDPEQDWLPHCIFCDARHTDKKPCHDFTPTAAEDKSSGPKVGDTFKKAS